MAKTFAWSIQHGAICICFFVKWQILLQVTFQAYKSSTFDSITHLKVQLFESYASWFAEELIEKHDHYQEKSPKI